MSDFTLPLRSVAVVGMSSSGKTTFAFEYLKRSKVVCRFIFDDQGQASARLKVPLCSTRAELERSLSTRYSLFNPHIMFPGDIPGALKWWCNLVFETCKRGPGPKQVFIDEVWRHVSPSSIPQEFAVLIQQGRVEDIEVITATQRPHKLNESILGQIVELVCFRLQHRLALQALTDLDIDDAELSQIQNLPLGSFRSYNLQTGKIVSGKVF
jgi:hypothetical protein